MKPLTLTALLGLAGVLVYGSTTTNTVTFVDGRTGAVTTGLVVETTEIITNVTDRAATDAKTLAGELRLIELMTKYTPLAGLDPYGEAETNAKLLADYGRSLTDLAARQTVVEDASEMTFLLFRLRAVYEAQGWPWWAYTGTRYTTSIVTSTTSKILP